jgi:disulfide oxidoreductase YuzD
LPSSKAVTIIRESLGRLFGSQVDVQYYDVGDPNVAAQHAALLSELADERLPLPLVLLNGTVIAAGSIDPLRVVATVAGARQQALSARGS